MAKRARTGSGTWHQECDYCRYYMCICGPLRDGRQEAEDSTQARRRALLYQLEALSADLVVATRTMNGRMAERFCNVCRQLSCDCGEGMVTNYRVASKLASAALAFERLLDSGRAALTSNGGHEPEMGTPSDSTASSVTSESDDSSEGESEGEGEEEESVEEEGESEEGDEGEEDEGDSEEGEGDEGEEDKSGGEE